MSQLSSIGICHTIEMHVTLISKAMVVKKSIGKNQKEKEENFMAQKEIEKIGGENLLELWFHFLSYETRFISD